MLPMLASDYKESKLKFPLWAQPKIDGVRGLCLNGVLTGRSLKTHKNKYTTAIYSTEIFKGFDGELAAEHECHPALCRLTSSAVGTITGEPYTLWHLFDYITESTKRLPYHKRYTELEHEVRVIAGMRFPGWDRLRVVPYVLCRDLEELKAADDKYLEQGYEGTIIRDPAGLYKEGRSTVTEGGLLRIKQFVEKEARVKSITEGQHNTNPSVVNETGHASRSSHAENMVPNGMVGSLECEDLETGKPITVARGCMTAEEAKLYFERPELILEQIIKYKTFPKGVKDKPRFPTFQSIRIASDIG